MIRSTLLVLCLALATLIPSARAAAIFELTPFTGDPTTMFITVTNVGDNKIQFSAVLDPLFGDISAIYMNVKDGIGGITASDFTSNVTLSTVCLVPTGTTSCGGNHNNLNGGNVTFPPNSFQVGLAFGKAGNDGFTALTFTFDYSGTGRTFGEYDFQPFAARVMSLPVDGAGSGGSAKLYTFTVPTPPNEENPIPEPSTLLMLGAGLGLLGLARVRRSRV